MISLAIPTLSIAALIPAAHPQEARPLQAAACDRPARVRSLGLATPGTGGLPELRMQGAPVQGRPFQLEVRGLPGAAGFLLTSVRSSPAFVPGYGATLFPGAPTTLVPFVLDAEGVSPALVARTEVTRALCGTRLVAQALVTDPSATGGIAVTKAASIRFGPGIGAPGFSAAGLTAEVPISPLDVVIQDIDGDQLPDLVTAGSGPSASGRLALFSSNGDGTFAQPVTLAASQQSFWTVVVEDFNGDGVQDIAAASPGGPTNLRGVVVFLGQGGGAFSPAVRYAAGPGPQGLVAADLNADQVPDLVATCVYSNATYPAGCASVLIGRGDGTFDPAVLYAAGRVSDEHAVGDVNGDGIPDVIVPNQARTSGSPQAKVSVLLGNGDGTLAPAVRYVARTELTTEALSVAIVDLDQDTFQDLVVLTRNSNYIGQGAVSVLRGVGDGSFLAPTTYAAAGNLQEVRVLDWNGDRNPDVLATAMLSSEDVFLFVGKGDGTLESHGILSAKGNPRGVALGDVDGDLDPDLVIVNAVRSELFLHSNRLVP